MRAADIDESFVPRRAAAAWTEELDGEAVILDEDHRRLHHLNRSATVTWTCFDGTGTVTEIAADLATAFAADVATVRAEVLALARRLGAEGLLAGVEPEPGIADGVELDPPEIDQAGSDPG